MLGGCKACPGKQAAIWYNTSGILPSWAQRIPITMLVFCRSAAQISRIGTEPLSVDRKEGFAWQSTEHIPMHRIGAA